MTRQEYEALTPADRALVEEAYRDGFLAAIEIVESCVQRIGDSRIDSQFIYNRDSIVDVLKRSFV